MIEINKICKICGKRLIKKCYFSKLSKSTRWMIPKKYCSNICRYKGLKKEKIISFCQVCNTKIELWPSKIKLGGGKFCSKNCRAKWAWSGIRNPKFGSNRIKEKNPNWRGGITTWRKLIYNSKEFKEWSRKVKKIWNFECQICGVKGGKLHSNHIKTFMNYPKLRFVISNGICLCSNCHIGFVNRHEKEWESYFNFCWENKNYDRNYSSDKRTNFF